MLRVQKGAFSKAPLWVFSINERACLQRRKSKHDRFENPLNFDGHPLMGLRHLILHMPLGVLNFLFDHWAVIYSCCTPTSKEKI